MFEGQRETVFTVTGTYVAYALLPFGAVASSILLPFVVQFRQQDGRVTFSVVIVLLVGLGALIWRLRRCGLFIEDERLVVRTVTRTTSIPLERLRVNGNRVSLAAKADMVPVFADTSGRTVKAGVLTGMDPEDKLGIVRYVLGIRDAATSSASSDR